MLTFPAGSAFAQTAIVRDERAAYRPYRVSVSRIQELSPSFSRVTFTAEEFRFFAPHGLDQRVKLVFPIGGRIADLGVDDPEVVIGGGWYARWRSLPEKLRNPFRTYTVRDIRPADEELDIDFVVHGHGLATDGPAARWLASAAVGDELVIVGPDARSLDSAIGIDWHPGTATELLLAGDETAAPAICSILASLAPGARARAFIEVPTAADAQRIESAADVSVTWIPRGGRGLEHFVRSWAADTRVYEAAIAGQRQELADIDVDIDLLWDSPADSPGEFYAWIAGESATVKSLRRFLVSELGVDRSRVAFMGYWRLGKSEAQG